MAGFLSTLFGQEKQGSPSVSYEKRGWHALPPDEQNAVLGLIRQVQATNDPEARRQLENYSFEPSDVAGNAELLKLQQLNPNDPMWQVGAIAQLNPLQKQSIQSANAGYGTGALADYYQPYEESYQAGAQEINNAADAYKQQISSQNALLNSRINPETNQQLQGQYADLEQRRGQSLGGLRGMLQGRQQEFATDTKFKHGQELWERGAGLQGQHQRELDVNSPGGRVQYDPRTQQAAQIMPYYSQLMQNSGYNYNQGATAARQTMRGKLVGAADKAGSQLARAFMAGGK